MAWQQQYATSTSPLPIRRSPNDDAYVEMRTYMNSPAAIPTKSKSSDRQQSPNRMESPQSYAYPRLMVDERASSHMLSTNGTGDLCTRPGCYEKDLRINTLMRQMDLCHDESKSLRTMLVEKKQELGSLQQRVVELEGELSSLKLTRQQELGSLQQRVSQLEGENNKLRQTRESLEMASVQHDQAHMQILQRQVEALQRRNQELISELAKANSLGDQQELIQLRGQKEKLQQEVQYLTGQLMQRKNCPDTRELEMYRTESRDLRGEVEILRQQVLAYTEDFHTERADRQRTQATLNKVQEERDNLQKTIDLLTQESGHFRHQ
ncbi:hypothetical protein EMCRGX_G006624 [Ephydatia muelleri]